MTLDQISALQQAKHAVLKLVASCTGCAIALYEPASYDAVREVLPLGEFEPYCQKIQSFPKGKSLCNADHVNRAKEIIKSRTGGLVVCHAGVFNQTLPIIIGGEVRAVLMYGQMWIEEDRRCTKARSLFEHTIHHLEPNEDDELELRVYYDEIKRLSKKDLKRLNGQLSLLQRFFYGMLSDALELDRYTETLIHDLQTRLQPILAHAQKLHWDLGQVATQCPSIEARVATADSLLQSTLALRVLIWNLSDYMPDYRFECYPLANLVEESVTLYRAEAERREIDFQIELQQPTRIQMSRIHLQHAINNLMHNAIKYSFHGRYDLDRYVEVLGEIDGSDYVLSFSNYGVGILPEEFDLVFEPGYKGQLTYEEHRSGSGMGLAITRDIIKKHHGKITVGSRETGGDAYVNEFIIRIPRMQLFEEEEK